MIDCFIPAENCRYGGKMVIAFVNWMGAVVGGVQVDSVNLRFDSLIYMGERYRAVGQSSQPDGTIVYYVENKHMYATPPRN